MTTHRIALVAPVDGLTPLSLVASDVNKKLESVILGAGLDYDSGGNLSILASEINHDLLLNVHQDVNTDASPQFAGLTLTGNITMPNAGIVGRLSSHCIKFNDTYTEIRFNSQYVTQRFEGNIWNSNEYFHYGNYTYQNVFVMNHTRGTEATPVIVNNNDGLGAFTARGGDGSVFRDAAQILFEVDGTPDSNVMPGRIRFITRPDTGTILYERLRISGSGNIGIGQITFGTNATKTLALGTGVAPTSSQVDSFQMYSADFAAGQACPHFRTENNVIIKLNQDLSTSANPVFAGLIVDTDTLFVDSVNHKVGVKTLTPLHSLDVVEADWPGASRGVHSALYGEHVHSAHITGRRARGTPSNPLSLQIDDYIAGFTAEGYDGVTFERAGYLAWITTDIASAGLTTKVVLAVDDAGTEKEQFKSFGSGTTAIGRLGAETYSDFGTTIYSIGSIAGNLNINGAGNRQITAYVKGTYSGSAPIRVFQGYGQIPVDNVNDLSSVNGITFWFEHLGAGDITDLVLFGGSLTLNNAGATVSNLIGFRAINPTVTAGVITSQTGFNVPALTQATNNTSVLLGTTVIPAGNFGIYDASGYLSHFSAALEATDLTLSAPVNIYSLSHDSFANYSANKHIDHTGVSISPGTGMSGGGTIASTRTLTCTITQYTDALARTACIVSSISDGDLTHSPDGNSVFDALALKAPIANPTFTGMATIPTALISGLTASEIVGTDASKNLTSLAVASYPSLTEISYVKGVTSALQTQMGLKAPLISPSFTTPTLGVASATSIGINGHTLDANEWHYLDGQDQSVITTSQPTFAGVVVSQVTSLPSPVVQNKLILLNNAVKTALYFGKWSTTSTATSGMVAHYKMNDNAADHVIADSSGNALDGVSIAHTDTMTVAGVINTALEFDGAVDYGRVTDNPLLNFGTGDFAQSFWIKTSGTISNKRLLGKNTGTLGWDTQILGTSGALWVFIMDASGSTAATLTSITVNLTDGNWHHIVLNWDRDGNVTPYADNVAFTGVSIASRSGSISNANDFGIGVYSGNWSSSKFTGSLDDIRLYNRLLTVQEIANLYNAGNGTEGGEQPFWTELAVV